MGRKCSDCGKMGHNSRTCPNKKRINIAGGWRLFGVQLEKSSSSSSSVTMKKSLSMDFISAPSSTPSSNSPSSSSSSSTSSRLPIEENSEKIPKGYLSADGLFGPTPERKKGVAWSEEEHEMFLAGLEKLGRGDWRGISRNFVTTRTPTQVASHAQKYFLRLNSFPDNKRRPSIFDVGNNKLTVQRGNAIADSSMPSEPSSLPLGFVHKNSCVIDFQSAEEQVCRGSQNSAPVWLQGSSESQSASSCLTRSSSSHVHNSAPDLQLTLATPKGNESE